MFSFLDSTNKSLGFENLSHNHNTFLNYIKNYGQLCAVMNILIENLVFFVLE